MNYDEHNVNSKAKVHWKNNLAKERLTTTLRWKTKHSPHSPNPDKKVHDRNHFINVLLSCSILYIDTLYKNEKMLQR